MTNTKVMERIAFILLIYFRGHARRQPWPWGPLWICVV